MAHPAEKYVTTTIGPSAVVRGCKLCKFYHVRKRVFLGGRLGRGQGMREGNKQRGILIQHIKAGGLVAVAVSSANRSRSLPDVPTVAESGFPGFEAGSWFGLFAPKGTPPEVIAQLNRATNAFIAERQVQSRMIDLNSPLLVTARACLIAFTLVVLGLGIPPTSQPLP